MVTNSLVVIQHGKPPPIERTIGPVEPHVTNKYTIMHLLSVNSLNKFVDSLLHALQDLRYFMKLAQGGAGRCGQRIVNAI